MFGFVFSRKFEHEKYFFYLAKNATPFTYRKNSNFYMFTKNIFVCQLQPGVEVDTLDEHPEDRGQVAEHEAGQHHPTHPGLHTRIGYLKT